MINWVMLSLSGMPLSKMKATEPTSVTDRLLVLMAKVSSTGLLLDTASWTEIRNKGINWMKMRVKGGYWRENGWTMEGQKKEN